MKLLSDPRSLAILSGEATDVPQHIVDAMRRRASGEKPRGRSVSASGEYAAPISHIGDRLKKVFGKLSLSSSCGSCDEEASRLNGMTSKEVMADIDAIAERILGRAKTLTGISGWIAKNVAAASPQASMLAIKGAITLACQHEPVKVIRRNPFEVSKTDKPRFITIEQYATDIRKLAAMVPPDVTCIAGVARSGLFAATMVAMLNHLPMITVRQTLGDIVETGNGWRIGVNKHVRANLGRVMVVDDTAFTGGSIRTFRPILNREIGHGNYIVATVYKNPEANLDGPDIWAVDLAWPHILEWNIFNSILSPSLAMDFDGILCHDCSPEQDDDGDKYREWMANAEPLYVPRRVPVPLIVTARLEKYRSITENWLSRWGVRFDRLVMHPAKSLAERNRDDIAAFKAMCFREWAASHKPSPGPIMFAESDNRQASRIHDLSGLMTICPAAKAVYS